MSLSKRNCSYAAEWDPQDGILIAWPHAGTDWAYMLNEVTACYIELARAILQDDERLVIVAPDGDEVRDALGPDVDWSRIDREDYMAAMERSPVRDTELRLLLRDALTDRVSDRAVFMHGVDASYAYEGYTRYKTEEL